MTMTTPPSLTGSMIPAPLSLAGPSEADLERDALFMADVDGGFLSRGVTAAEAEAVRETRLGMVATIAALLRAFVARAWAASSQQRCAPTNPWPQSAGIASTSFGGVGATGASVSSGAAVDANNSSSDAVWADVRPFGSVAVGADLVDSDIDLYEIFRVHSKKRNDAFARSSPIRTREFTSYYARAVSACFASRRCVRVFVE